MFAALGVIASAKAEDGPSLFTIPPELNWTPSFDIYEDGTTYSTNFDPDSIKPVGTEMWISPTGSDTTGNGTSANPFYSAKKAYDTVGGVTNIKAKAGIYKRIGSGDAGFNPAHSVSIESVDGAGKAIFTRVARGLVWTQEGSPNTSVYSSPRSAVEWVIDLTGPTRSGEFLKDGETPLPIELTRVASVAACQALPHSWYQSGTSSPVYVHTHDSRAPDANLLVSLNETIFNPTNNITFWLDGIEGWGRGAARMIMTADNTAKFCWQNSASRFLHQALNNGAQFSCCNEVYSINCDVTDVTGNGDAFNYHADSGAPTTVCHSLEVDCNARRIGLSGQTNNNCTTAHDGCVAIRLGGEYLESYGPQAADVLDAQGLFLGGTYGNPLITGSFQACGIQSGTVEGIWTKNCTYLGTQYARVQSGSGLFYNMGGDIDNTTLGDHGSITPYP